MAITIKCPACSARMTLRDDLAGKKIRCPKCQQAPASLMHPLPSIPAKANRLPK